MRHGPENDILQDYLTRFSRTGRPLGLGSITVHEADDRKGGGMQGEAQLLQRSIPKGAVTVALDERGKTLTSPQFANHIAQWRDEGQSDLAFVIGGADGIAPELRQQADYRLSFGTMVWPHMLIRAMLSEQLYRAATILGGGPYHRE